MIGQLNTPLDNPLQEGSEIEVTNPNHPLFSRRFPVLSVSNPRHSIPNVFVSYREYMVLRIPLPDTNLSEARPAVSTKLTLQSLNEFISIAKECEELCQTTPKTSGKSCHQNPKNKSLKNSY